MIDNRIEEKLGFDKIRKLISDKCYTEYASDKVWKEEISKEPKEIIRRLELTDEMRLILMFESSFPTSGYVDCIDFLRLLENEGYIIDLLSLAKLKTLLETLSQINVFFDSIKEGIYPILQKLNSKVDVCPEVKKAVDKILDKYGNIKDNASDELYAIRKNIKELESNISKLANSILKKAQQENWIEKDVSLSVRDGRFLIPVPTINKKKIKGLIYDESSTGKTYYVEPEEVTILFSQINQLRFDETKEIHKILSEFSDFSRPFASELQLGAIFIGEIDFFSAKAQLSLEMIAGKPILADNNQMNIRKARNPILEKALKKEGKQIVPLSISLSEDKHILLISGPNAGGKSVCLKTLGLLQYMFQWGMLIPVSEISEMLIFDRIMISMGDNQNIENDLSTYSSFLLDMKNILREADNKTLVLIDEFGSGTEPAAGGAIAEAILAELDSRGTYAVITTHFTNLKLYASSQSSGVVNASMQFDTQNIMPLFKLDIGLPGNSFAFELARKMGLPESIVKDAQERVGEEYVGIEKNLKKILKNRRSIETKLKKIKHTDRTLENITDKYQKELSEIKNLRKSILEEAHREANKIIKDANKNIENTIRQIKEAQAEKKQTREAREQLNSFIFALGQKKETAENNRENYLNEKLKSIEKSRTDRAKRQGKKEKVEVFKIEQKDINIGEKVRILSNGMIGEVLSLSKNFAIIMVGSMTIKQNLNKIERISSNEFKAVLKQKLNDRPLQRIDPAMIERKLNFKPEIDIRGERLSEALDLVARYIDDAIMLEMKTVRIIHGKGSGVLREELQKYIRTIRGVQSVKDEQIQFGGSGVSVITFD